VDGLIGERRLFLSLALPTPGECRLAFAIMAISLAACLAATPFAQVALPPLPIFIALYQSTLVICDVITAVLLFGQFRMLRSRALLMLASGYLFTALMAVVHAVSFPGLFAPAGLLGAGGQSTAWLYMFWHGGFPVAVIAYALLKRPEAADAPAGRIGRGAVPAYVLVTAAAVLGLTLLATAGEALLPRLMQGNRYTPAMIGTISTVWGLSFIGLVLLWRRRPYTVLDLWLLVVMAAWLFDIALSAVLNAGRYDLGFYAGRAYGLLAAGFVLVVLLLQTLSLYTELALANDNLRDLAQRDGLTGIFNRRRLNESLGVELPRAHRQQQPLSLLLIDVDHFKKFNDLYGHLDGDACLRSIAGAIARSVKRPGDLAARYGGEEFAVLLPATEPAGAAEVAEAIRANIEKAAIPHASNGGGVATVSIGVATLLPNVTTTVDDLIGAADQSLYAAKSAGRNRVVSAAAGRDPALQAC
jgi:diguanylate cyclase (GGDEF)-like protein